MTRDYQYVAGRLGDLAQLSGDPADDAADTGASFSPAVSYVDYASSVEDILALCMTGFPSFDSTSSHRRSLIYLGPGQIRERRERRRSLLTAAIRSAAWRASRHPDQRAEHLEPKCRRPPVDREIVWWPILLTRRASRTSSPVISTPFGDSPPAATAAADEAVTSLVRRCTRRPAGDRRGGVHAAVPVADGAATMTFQPVLPPSSCSWSPSSSSRCGCSPCGVCTPPPAADGRRSGAGPA